MSSAKNAKQETGSEECLISGQRQEVNAAFDMSIYLTKLSLIFYEDDMLPFRKIIKIFVDR
jgi:hypothetical protein